MKQKLIFIICFLFCLSPLHAEVINSIVATVNSEIITEYDIEQQAKELIIKSNDPQQKTQKIPHPLPDDLKEKVLSRLIGEMLLTQEIEASKIEVTNAEIDQAVQNILSRNKMTPEQLKKELAQQGSTLGAYKEDLKKQIRRFKYISQNISNKVRVSDEEVQKVLSQLPSTAQGEIELAQIVFPFQDSSSEKSAKKEADQIYQKIKKGSSFEEVSNSLKQEGNGSLGKLDISSLQENVQKALSGLKSGEISHPVKSDSSYTLYKIVSVDSSNGSNQAALKERIQNQIYDEKIQKELEKLVDELKSKSYVIIHDHTQS